MLGNQKNLDEAIIIATNFETLTNERTYEVNNLKKQSNYKNINNRGENRKTNANASIKCYNCNKIGHKANVCYNKDKNKKPWKKNEGEAENSATPKPKANITCRKCNKLGHYANECRSAVKKVNSIEVNSLEINTLTIKEIYAVAEQKIEINSVAAESAEIFAFADTVLDNDDKQKPSLSSENLIINEIIRDYLK